MMIGGLYLSNILVCKNESRWRLVQTTNDNVIMRHSAFAQIVPQEAVNTNISISYIVSNVLNTGCLTNRAHKICT